MAEKAEEFHGHFDCPVVAGDMHAIRHMLRAIIEDSCGCDTMHSSYEETVPQEVQADAPDKPCDS